MHTALVVGSGGTKVTRPRCNTLECEDNHTCSSVHINAYQA